MKTALFFLFLLENVDCGYSLEPPRRGGSNEYHILCFKQKYKKYQSFLSENFQFLEVKFSIYLYSHVFVMNTIFRMLRLRHTQNPGSHKKSLVLVESSERLIPGVRKMRLGAYHKMHFSHLGSYTCMYTLWANSADAKLIFFLFFPQKIDIDISFA